MQIAWGNRVSLSFVVKVVDICGRLGIEPSWLTSVCAFETGATFSPSIRNAAGSGAVGLIQFMPNIAAALGTTTDELAGMTAEDQLDYVEKYFHPWAGRLHSLGDTYGAVIWPAMIGKPDGWIVFNQADPNHPKRYIQNRGLDFNKDGVITKAEIVSRVERELEQGLQPGNVLEFTA